MSGGGGIFGFKKNMYFSITCFMSTKPRVSDPETARWLWATWHGDWEPQLRWQQMYEQMYDISFFSFFAGGRGGHDSFTQPWLYWELRDPLASVSRVCATTPGIWHGLNYEAISPVSNNFYNFNNY